MNFYWPSKTTKAWFVSRKCKIKKKCVPTLKPLPKSSSKWSLRRRFCQCFRQHEWLNVVMNWWIIRNLVDFHVNNVFAIPCSLVDLVCDQRHIKGDGGKERRSCVQTWSLGSVASGPLLSTTTPYCIKPRAPHHHRPDVRSSKVVFVYTFREQIGKMQMKVVLAFRFTRNGRRVLGKKNKKKNWKMVRFDLPPIYPSPIFSAASSLTSRALI